MIQTNRLILRRWRAEDQADLHDILGDPEVMAFSDAGPLAPAAQIAWLEKACASGGEDLLSGPFAIARKTDGRVLGYVRLASNPERVQPGEAEIGFRLARHAWGQGYATEAASELIQRAHKVPAISRIVAIVDPHNARSLRALERLGMVQAGTIMFDGYDYPDAVYTLQL